jgi:biofilm PGA synthesis protein PgaA
MTCFTAAERAGVPRAHSGRPVRAAVRTTVLVAAALAALLAGRAVHAQTAEREAAVLLARRGELEPAIARLTDLHRRYPADVSTASDLAVVLHWAGRNAEALEVFAAIGPEAAPAYALLVGARAARAAGRLDLADAYLARGAERFPAERGWSTTRVLVLVDQGRLDEARDLAETLAETAPTDREIVLVQAYVYRQAGDWPDALRLYSEVLRQAPDHREALNGRAMALQALGAPFRAEELARGEPGVLDAAERARVAGSRSAMLLRWSQLASDDPRAGLAVTDRAITELERRVAALRAEPGLADAARRARFDLLVAYRDRQRMAEAVATYEDLRREAVVPPGYARLSAAAAYLYLEQPEAAADLYRAVLAESPRDYEARLGLFYALVELEQYGDAYAVIDGLDRDEPPFRAYADTRATFENSRKLDTALVAGLARYYGDQLAEAWERISALAESAPANTWLQASAASVARSRGWPRRALSLVEPWLTLVDDGRDLELERAASLLALRRYREAEEAVARLEARYPDDKDLQALRRDLDTYRLWNLETRFEPSKGDEPTANGVGLQVTTRLFSPPIGENWRVMVGTRYAGADTPEGHVDLFRGALGLEYRGPGLYAAGAVTYNVTTVEEAGGRLQGVWTPDDHWRLYAGGEIFAETTPMRALKHGVTADAAEAGVGYRFHESRDVDLAWRYTDFSDGNRRHEVFARLSQRVFDRPRFDVTATLDLYYSTNTESNVFYYSPTSVFTPSVIVLLEHLAWRRYRSSLVQALQLTLGGTFQEGFAGAAIGGAEYSHRWRWDPRFELSYGIRAGSRVFDGDREADYAGFVQLNARF